MADNKWRQSGFTNKNGSPPTSDSSFRLPQSGKTPRTGKAGSFRAIFWAMVALIMVGAAAFWLTREDGQKNALRDAAADGINTALSSTPLAGMGDILRASPPPPPPQVLNPPTAPGTLSGRTVTGTIGSPPDFISSNSQAPGSSGASSDPASVATENTFSHEPLPPVSEDSTIRSGYLNEIATWLASRYQPGSSGGTLSINVQGLNNLGSATMGQAKGGRASVLRYAFHPSMLQGLYNLYVDKFMEDLNSAAQKRGLSEAQNKQFHLALAGRAAMMATALEGIAQTPDLGDRLAQIDKLAQKSVEINEQLAQAVFELDELRDSKAESARIATVQMRVDGITARYRRSVDDQEAARRALVAEIRKRSGQTMDEDSLLFLAAWAERRISGDASGLNSLKACAGILRNLAERCEKSAR